MRWVSLRYNCRLECQEMIRRSKYYIAEESWTGGPAWAFEVPTDYVESDPDNVVTLRFETGPSTGEYSELQVPCSYLKEHLSGLWVRADHWTASLFLSASVRIGSPAGADLARSRSQDFFVRRALTDERLPTFRRARRLPP